MTFRLTNIAADDLFNLPLFEHHLVIDTRSAEEYAAGHIATAVSLPSPDAEEFSEEKNEGLLVAFVLQLVDDGLNPDNITPIVLYGGGSKPEDNERFMRWLVERLNALKASRPLHVANVGGGLQQHPEQVYVLDAEEYRPEVDFSKKLSQYGKEIWVLAGGYEVFRETYPFLCGNIDFNAMVPMPHKVTSHIFMGSRHFRYALAEDTSWLHHLGITHVIVNSDQVLASEQGLSVLRCGVSDDQSSDMSVCFDAATLYINEAIASNSKVLVQVFGRSRSASIIIAWFMQHCRLSYQAALQTLEKRCWKRIDTNWICAKQLQARQLPQAIQDAMV